MSMQVSQGAEAEKQSKTTNVRSLHSAMSLPVCGRLGGRDIEELSNHKRDNGHEHSDMM